MASIESFIKERLLSICLQVTPFLLTVFMDHTEPREIRATAFLVIIDSNPSFTTLQIIAHKLLSEPSQQIRSLVYTTFVKLATLSSHEPENKEL